MNHPIEDHVMALALARKEAQESKQDVDVMWNAVEHTLEYRAWAKSHSINVKKQGVVNHLEAVIKQMALMTQEVQWVHDAIPLKIKTFKKLVYEWGIALGWCKDALPSAITFNVKEFEKVAATGALPFVKIEDERRAQIAGNLAEFIPNSREELNVVESILLIAAKVVETDTGDDEPVA